MKLQSYLFSAFFLFTVLLAGCDAVESLRGEHVVEIDGDIAEAFSGDAVWSVVDGRFILLLSRDDLYDNDDDDYTYVALVRPGDSPGVGVFAIDDDPGDPQVFSGNYADLVEADEPLDTAGPVLSATSGLLTITKNEAGYLMGSFRFDGLGLDLPDRSEFIEASVDGLFEARPVGAGVIRSLEVDFDLD